MLNCVGLRNKPVLSVLLKIGGCQHHRSLNWNKSLPNCCAISRTPSQLWESQSKKPANHPDHSLGGVWPWGSAVGYVSTSSLDRLRAYVGGESQNTRQLKPTIGDYMNDYIDMHIHTTYSDGTLTPSEILERSLEIGLKAISITDHNTIDGVTEAMKYANNAIEIIPGIEMTATYPKPLHILGYYIDIHSASFNAGIKTLRMQKYKWLLMLVRNLKKIGIDIDLDEIKHKYGRIKLEYIALELANQGIAENIRDISFFSRRNYQLNKTGGWYFDFSASFCYRE